MKDYQKTWGKLKNYRLRDNYLRFYLKYIEPNFHKIQNNLFENTVRQDSCQIDFLIQTQLGVFYVCEIKLTTQTVGISVIEEVKSKIKKLKTPRNSATIPVLIYFGECSEELLDSGYFPRIVEMGKFFKD